MISLKTLHGTRIEDFAEWAGVKSWAQSLRWRLFFAMRGMSSLATSPYRHTPLPMQEAPVLQDIFSRLKGSDVFYDIGANQGSFTIPAAHCGATVVAFEPHPENIRALKKAVEANAVQNSVTIENVALGEENGEVEMEIGDSPKSHRLNTGAGADTMMIDVVRGDDYISKKQLPAPNVMKIDIEGAEAMALRGLLQTIQTAECRTIYCEIHLELMPDYGDQPGEVKDILSDSGYSIEILHSRKSGEFIRATK